MAGRMQQVLSSCMQLQPSLLGHFKSYGHYWACAATFATIIYVTVDTRVRPFLPAALAEGNSEETAKMKKSPYPMDTSAIFVLPDGRKLGYAQFGVITQSDKPETETSGKGQRKTIFYCHGLPGARIEIACLDPVAKRLNARIIAVDRPGHGWSSPHPGRTLLDHARDIEQLAEHFQLEEYGVLGVSGGGPSVLACAALLPPSKLKAATIVCGLGPPEIGVSGMDLPHKLGFLWGWPYLSKLTWYYFKWQPEARLDLTDEKRFELIRQRAAKSAKTDHPKDVEAFKDLDFVQLYVRTSREAYSQGWDGIGQDGKLSSTNFGFKLEDIQTRSPNLRVRLWYGKHDCYVPANIGKGIAKRLGNLAYLRIEDETHASLFVNWKERFLEDLVENM